MPRFARHFTATETGQNGAHGCAPLAVTNEPPVLVLKDEVEQYYEKEFYHGWLYPNLYTFVDKGRKDNRTTVYSIITVA